MDVGLEVHEGGLEVQEMVTSVYLLLLLRFSIGGAS